MVAVALSVLALAAGVYLLVKVKSAFLSSGFTLLAWLVILLSLVSFGFAVTKGVHSGNAQCHKKQVNYHHGATCSPQSSSCKKACAKIENKDCAKQCGGGQCEGKCKGVTASCGSNSTLEGDSAVAAGESSKKCCRKQ